MNAKFASTCPWCGRAIAVGQDITKHQRRYGHTACVAEIGELKRTLPQVDGSAHLLPANKAEPARNLKAFWRVYERDTP
jgi:hypothetical protein